MWRLGSDRAEVLSLLGERMRFVCAQAGLWAATQPDTLQLTKMAVGQNRARRGCMNARVCSEDAEAA